jgi:PIN like domain
LPDLLKRVGMQIEVHYDYFSAEEDDEFWIAECAKRDWAIISGDKGLERDPVNRKAVIDSGAKVFLLTDTHSRVEVWAAAIILGRRKMAELVHKLDGPFFATISKESSSHISAVKFVGSGAPKQSQKGGVTVPNPMPAVSMPAQLLLPNPPVQQELKFVANGEEQNADDDLICEIEERARKIAGTQ